MIRIRGAHIMNHGRRAGSRGIAARIRSSGSLVAGFGAHGFGAYAHFVENIGRFGDVPYVLFEADVVETRVHRVEAVPVPFFMVRCEAPVDELPIRILEFVNLD